MSEKFLATLARKPSTLFGANIMIRCKELAAAAVSTIVESMARWQNAELQDEEPELIAALQVVIDLSGGLRWIEAHPGIDKGLEQPMRAGEFVSFDWKRYRSELYLRYHGVDLWLTPAITQKLMVIAVA